MRFDDEMDETKLSRSDLSPDEVAELSSIEAAFSALLQCSGCGVFFRLSKTISLRTCPRALQDARDHCDRDHEPRGHHDSLRVSTRVALVMDNEGTWPEHLRHVTSRIRARFFDRFVAAAPLSGRIRSKHRRDSRACVDHPTQSSLSHGKTSVDMRGIDKRPTDDYGQTTGKNYL